MTFAVNSELPSRVRGILPEAAQTRFRQAANEALAKGAPEQLALRQGWIVVKKDWEKGDPTWARRADGGTVLIDKAVIRSDNRGGRGNPNHNSEDGKFTSSDGDSSSGTSDKDDRRRAKVSAFQQAAHEASMVEYGGPQGAYDYGSPEANFSAGMQAYRNAVLRSEAAQHYTDRMNDPGTFKAVAALVAKHIVNGLIEIGIASAAAAIMGSVVGIILPFLGRSLTRIAPALAGAAAGRSKQISSAVVSKIWGAAQSGSATVAGATHKGVADVLRNVVDTRLAAKPLFATPPAGYSPNPSLFGAGFTGKAPTRYSTFGVPDRFMLPPRVGKAAEDDHEDLVTIQLMLLLEAFENLDPSQLSSEQAELWLAQNEPGVLKLVLEGLEAAGIATPDEKAEAAAIDARVVKVDKSLGLVFGWAIICKRDGKDYYDLNIDSHSGERVPEHIPETAMLEAASDFMQNSRVAKEMHSGDETGSIVFAFPMTTDIAKAMGIETATTGLLVAMKPNPDMLAKFASGELTGFSIGGSRVKSREMSDES